MLRALDVVRKSGTLQEYRKIWQPIGEKGADGMRAAKEVEYRGFVAIIGPRPDKMRVILRRVGARIEDIADGRQRLAPEKSEAN